MAEEQQENVEIPIVWEEVDERSAHVSFVNNFLIQHQPDEFVITIGQVVRPPIVGDTEAARREAIAKIPYIPVRVLGRYGMTRRRLVELIEVMQENLRRHDEMMKSQKEQG